MFDSIRHVADILRHHADDEERKYKDAVKAILHGALDGLEAVEVSAQVVTSIGADKTGPGANVLNAGEVKKHGGEGAAAHAPADPNAGDNSANALNAQELQALSAAGAPAA